MIFHETFGQIIGVHGDFKAVSKIRPDSPDVAKNEAEKSPVGQDDDEYDYLEEAYDAAFPINRVPKFPARHQ